MTVKDLYKKAMALPVDSDGYLSEGMFTVRVMKKGGMIDIYHTLSLKWSLLFDGKCLVVCEIINGEVGNHNAVYVDEGAPSAVLPTEVREALLTVGVVGRRHL
jgi:hypothetical protein|nr:MAG TPA: hypothetical protein [Caudoviricetes sp.]